MPDEADQREIRHVVLRVVLRHRRAEGGRRGEVGGRGQRLVAEDESQMIRERLAQGVTRRRVDGSGQVDTRDQGAQGGMYWLDAERRHADPPGGTLPQIGPPRYSATHVR